MMTQEFNIEGNPKEQSFVDLVLEVRPEQVTLVPDAVGQLTSNHGWNTVAEREYLTGILRVFKDAGIRTSVFVDPLPEMVEGAALIGTDRIELYTEAYAQHYHHDREAAIAPYVAAASIAGRLGLGLNAGHDLDLHNLEYFAQQIPGLLEVSIGHALVCDSLYYGLDNTIGMYLRKLDFYRAG
jgi:pyridoxine 5-phosphate synthase